MKGTAPLPIFIYPLIFLIFFCCLPAIPIVSAATTSSDITFDRWGISFSYPVDWQEYPAEKLISMKQLILEQLIPVQITLLEYTLIRASDNNASIMVAKTIREAPVTSLTLRDERQEVHQEAINNGEISKINFLEQTIICGYPAVTEDFERTNLDRTRSAKIIDDAIIYEITLVVYDKNNFPLYQPIFDRVLDSLIITADLPSDIGPTDNSLQSDIQ